MPISQHEDSRCSPPAATWTPARFWGTKFKRFKTYRSVDAAELTAFALLLPTFTAPHWSLMFLAPDGSEVDEDAFFGELLAILRPVLDNPKYEPNQTTREE